ncbi:MAG: hypothetical protein L0229_25930 [Blastocatellia bacterium]|nr:hypothetical protein [Blastocatellia bacterium]
MKNLFTIRSIIVAIFGLFFMLSAAARTDASCVVNKTRHRVFIEYYGQRVDPPTFDRGGEWVGPGESLCLAGQGGDWLVLPPDWLYGKSADWQRRERDGLGGTSDRPRYYPVWVAVARNGRAEITGFEKWSESRGWWVQAVCRIYGDYVFTLELTGAEYDYVFVNDTREGRHVRSQQSGWANLPLTDFLKDGFNTVEIWKNRVGFSTPSGTQYVLKRNGQVVMRIPAQATAMGLAFPGWKEVARISVNKTTGDSYIYRGWGRIDTCEGNNLIKAGWQPTQAYVRRPACRVTVRP